MPDNDGTFRPGISKQALLGYAAVFVSFLIIFAVPLWDIDLWWHLATGRYIVEHRSLLAADPFSYTSGHDSSLRAIILNGYWLSQVILYQAHSVFGNYGIIAFRVLVLISILFMVLRIGRRLGAEDPALIIVLVMTGFVSRRFTGERPQLFSFLLAPVVFYLLNDLKEAYSAQRIASSEQQEEAYSVKRVASMGQQKEASGVQHNTPYTLHPSRLSHNVTRCPLPPARYFLLPLTMLLWANLHRGFMMGTALIALFGVSETVRLYLKRGIDKPFLKGCLIMAVAISASFINPNTYKPYLELIVFQASALQQRTSEYLSPVTLMLHRQYLVSYWLYLTASAIVFGLSSRRMDKTNLLIFVFLAALSLSAFRYIPFFVFVTAPYVALYLSDILKIPLPPNGRGEKKGTLYFARPISVLAALLVIATFMFMLKSFDSTLGSALRHPTMARRFPEKAASFIEEHHLPGRIFNHFNWGGYLIWRLYPERRVFIDGRALSLKAFSDYTEILWDKDKWKALLGYYGVRVIVMPRSNPLTGELYELINRLYEDPDWALVYSDDTAMVFLNRQ